MCRESFTKLSNAVNVARVYALWSCLQLFSIVYARVNETAHRGGCFDETHLSERIKERKYSYSHVLAALFQREILQDVSIVHKQ